MPSLWQDAFPYITDDSSSGPLTSYGMPDIRDHIRALLGQLPYMQPGLLSNAADTAEQYRMLPQRMLPYVESDPGIYGASPPDIAQMPDHDVARPDRLYHQPQPLPPDTYKNTYTPSNLQRIWQYLHGAVQS